MKTRLSILLVSLTLFTQTCAQTHEEPSGRRLCDIVADKYADGSIIIGGTTGAWAFGTNTGLIMDREFSYVTPENDFKQWNIHPDPDTWNWEQPDAWVDHIADNGQILRMHCPIGPQCSKWAETDSRTAEELEGVMREFMQAVCEQYDGVEGIEYMDVVNETVQGGNWKKDETGTGGWELPWYKIGRDTDANKTPLYIRYAFEIANQYAPHIKFIYNHHEGPESASSWNRIKQTIAYLRGMGLRVDGIGWQAHVSNGWATTSHLNKLRELIDWAHGNDLEFHVTEAGSWINGSHDESAFQMQATTYSKIVEVLLEKRFSGKVGWNTWHIDDGHGWQKEKAPAIFDASYKAKPAYYAIQDVLENPPTKVLDSPKGSIDIFQLQNNYPNPFNPETSISFCVPELSHVTIDVFNTRGELITKLLNEQKSPGEYSVGWNGTNDQGDPMPSGIYFCRAQANGFVETLKMALAK